jgi:hypothetical protein
MELGLKRGWSIKPALILYLLSWGRSGGAGRGSLDSLSYFLSENYICRILVTIIQDPLLTNPLSWE